MIIKLFIFSLIILIINVPKTVVASNCKTTNKTLQNTKEVILMINKKHLPKELKELAIYTAMRESIALEKCNDHGQQVICAGDREFAKSPQFIIRKANIKECANRLIQISSNNLNILDSILYRKKVISPNLVQKKILADMMYQYGEKNLEKMNLLWYYIQRYQKYHYEFREYVSMQLKKSFLIYSLINGKWNNSSFGVCKANLMRYYYFTSQFHKINTPHLDKEANKFCNEYNQRIMLQYLIAHKK
jgi:hypothetical protein